MSCHKLRWQISNLQGPASDKQLLLRWMWMLTDDFLQIFYRPPQWPQKLGRFQPHLYFMVLCCFLYRCFPVHVPTAAEMDIACPLLVMLFHICRLPWHLVSERIRKKIIFHSLKCFIHLSHKTLRLRQSCVSAIKAKCCMNNRHDLLYTRTALALNYLLQGQIPAGLHLFMISVSFFPMLIFYFLFFKPYLEDKRKAHAANIYFIAMMISCNISQSDSQHNIQVTALECGYDWVCLLHSDSR